MIYLRHVQEMPAADFGLEQAEYEALLKAQETRMEVVALRVATDGYYDIELGDGSKYPAISVYHLGMLSWSERMQEQVAKKR